MHRRPIRQHLEALERRMLLSSVNLLASLSSSQPSGVLLDSGGNLFGTTAGGGTAGDGLVFELQKGSTAVTTIASFHGIDGAVPSGLIADADGDLFGTTGSGGSLGLGTVFEIVAGSNTITTLASFNGYDGVEPSTLALDSNGDLFGTTINGGDSNGDGTIFKVVKNSNAITTLYTFADDADAASPAGGVVLDSSGDLFGTTTTGGNNGNGTIFELVNGATALTTLAPFNDADGANASGLSIDSNGNLFGAAVYGGDADGDGTLFELPHGSGVITTLYSFSGNADGGNPAGDLVIDSNGDLIGTTSAGGASADGTVFELASGASTVSTLASFNGADGANAAGVVMAGNGDLFGSTQAGGVSGQGTLFELSTPLTAAPLVVSSPVNQTAVAGDTVTFTASAGGVPTPTVQWQISTDNGSTFTNIAGATATRYGFLATAGQSGNQYRAVFTNVLGTVTTTWATLTLSSTPIAVTWTGTDANDIWNDPANWSNDQVPTAQTDATIGAGFGTIEIVLGPSPVRSLTTASPIEVADDTTLSLFSTASFNGGLTIDAGTQVQAASAPLSVVVTGLIDNGTLDLAGDTMIVHNGSLPQISALVAAGYAGGEWNGSGIVSTSAANDAGHLTALGAIVNSANGNPIYPTLNGVTLASTDVLVGFTYYGDTNLDGKVDGSDYSRVDNGFLNHLTGCANGDLNYDGVVDGSDYTLIDNAFNRQGATLDAELATQVATAAEPRVVHAAVVVSPPPAINDIQKRSRRSVWDLAMAALQNPGEGGGSWN